MSEDYRRIETATRTVGDGTGPLAEAFGRISDAVYALDTTLEYTFCNERTRTLFEDRDAADRAAADEVDAPTSALEALFGDAHERALERQRPLTVEEYADADDAWYEARLFPDETGVTVIVREITDRKERERDLEAGNRRLRSIFEDAHDAILVGDEDEITAANPAASDLFGLDRSELAGRSLKEFIHDDHDVGSAWDEFLERGRLRGSFSLVRPDGSERIVEYNSVADVMPGTHLSILRDVTDARRREQQLERQRKRLAALDHVNGVVREINDAIVGGSTRTELEEVTCESLADSPSYEFAFVADVDVTTRTVSPRVEAGVEDSLETVPCSTDAAEPAGRGPVGEAVRTGELRASNDVFADPDFEPWRDDARDRGYRSVAAIPITHDGVLYGVLGVASARRNAFADEERDVVGQLGEILGHAIAALERRRVLLGDELIELELVIDDAVAMFDGPDLEGRTIEFDRVVRIGDERYLEYGTTSVETVPLLESLVDRVPHWDAVTVLDESAGEATFELSISSPPLFGVVDAHGGYVESAALQGSDYTTTIHFPTGTDVRAVLDEITDVYPGTRTVARRQLSPSSESVEQLRTRLAETLTDRQRTALETAYFGGYFEWPRNSSGEEIADAMDVTPATFHEHLRAAQAKVVGAIVDGPHSAAT